MTKADLKLLERIFAREIEGALFQGRGKRIERLAKDGYCVQIERHFGEDRFGKIAVRGYVLTLLGNFTYCMTC